MRFRDSAQRADVCMAINGWLKRAGVMNALDKGTVPSAAARNALERAPRDLSKGQLVLIKLLLDVWSWDGEFRINDLMHLDNENAVAVGRLLLAVCEPGDDFAKVDQWLDWQRQVANNATADNTGKKE